MSKAPLRRRPQAVPTGPEALEKRIRAAYRREREAFETLKAASPVDYKIPRRYDGMSDKTVEGELVVEKGVAPVWRRLAAFFAARRIDPDIYIQCQFALLLPTMRAPEPPQLTGDKLLDRWRADQQSRDKFLPSALEGQKSVAASQIVYLRRCGNLSPIDALVGALLNTSLELSPLFRHSMACRMLADHPEGVERLLRIAQHFEAEAAVQFELDRSGYWKHWRIWLPDGFPRRAKVIYEALFRGLLSWKP